MGSIFIVNYYNELRILLFSPKATKSSHLIYNERIHLMRPLEKERIKRQTNEINGKTKEECEKRRKPNPRNVYIYTGGRKNMYSSTVREN